MSPVAQTSHSVIAAIATTIATSSQTMAFARNTLEPYPRLSVETDILFKARLDSSARMNPFALPAADVRASCGLPSARCDAPQPRPHVATT